MIRWFEVRDVTATVACHLLVLSFFAPPSRLSLYAASERREESDPHMMDGFVDEQLSDHH